MNNTTKRAYVLYAVVALFFVGMGILIYSFIANGAQWATSKANRHLYSDGSTVMLVIYSRLLDT